MSESRDEGRSPGDGRDTVDIKINAQTVSIHRGHQPASAIKTAGGVPQADELEQVVNGKLVPVPDGGITIKGGEVFVSHPRDSGSANA